MFLPSGEGARFGPITPPLLLLNDAKEELFASNTSEYTSSLLSDWRRKDLQRKDAGYVTAYLRVPSP
jgi:hypothetical protein